MVQSATPGPLIQIGWDDNTRRITCTARDGGGIRLTSDTGEVMRFHNSGMFAGRGQYSQSVTGTEENRQRICGAWGYTQSSGETTNINSSLEAVLDADLQGFTSPANTVNFNVMECF